MAPAPALVVEDSAEFAQMARRVLEQEGFVVSVAATGEDGLALARRTPFELMLVDVSLPGIDGFEVCRQVRTFSDAYVVMVTGRSEEVEKVVGFRVGADDYVTKPYSVSELSARIGAMRRRPRRPERAAARGHGDLVLDVGAREVTLAGAAVELTRTEFDLLDALSASPRQVFTRAQLLQAVWGYGVGDDHVVDVHVANLRRKLGESAAQQRYVVTVRGVGYRFEPDASVPAG